MTMSSDQAFPLASLYFGKDDAESDIAAGGLLKAGFLETAAYKAVLDGRKMLIIGRKGSGKSAICVTLACDQNLPFHACLVTPDEISADELRRFELPGIRSPLAKELVWRYILAVQTAKYVVAHARDAHSESQPSSVAAVRKFLLENGEADDLNFHEKFWKVIKKLSSSLSLEAFGVKVGVNDQPTPGGAPPEGVRASGQLDVLEENIKIALDELQCPDGHPPIVLLIDQIEKVWSNDEDSDALVVGLLQAAKHVSRAFPQVRCAVFLRTDIYDFLQFGDRDKFRGDEMRIDWTPARLLELVRARATASLSREVTHDDLWRAVFSERVGKAKSDKYVIARTLMRPRDLIQFCNLCRDTAEKNGNRIIESSDIIEATTQYSNWKIADLVNEYLVNYPFLGDLFVLFQNTGYLFSRRTLASRFEAMQASFVGRYPQFSSALTVDGILDVLYAVGFIGVRRRGAIVYSYEDPDRIEPHETNLVLHPCFREALRSVSAADLHPYRPTIVGERFISQRRSRAGSPVLRGSAGFEAAESLIKGCKRVRAVVGSSNLPPEIAEEIYGNLDLLLRDLDTSFVGHDDFALLLDLIPRAQEFFSELAARLTETDLIEDASKARVARTLLDVSDRVRHDASGWARRYA
ncbi:P-loop ATPase, Sll1717 family [Streptomyces sp. NBC_00286]|uniref:P-loop ATPase, Sll1717 family n=1 Tax=Streptomyces sp. NBC_00286 TaxID=2975701 RepID=UPI002E2B6E4F|nr:hypothetical protein [Streptomyces sp. NBC_00286]